MKVYENINIREIEMIQMYNIIKSSLIQDTYKNMHAAQIQYTQLGAAYEKREGKKIEIKDTMALQFEKCFYLSKGRAIISRKRVTKKHSKESKEGHHVRTEYRR